MAKKQKQEKFAAEMSNIKRANAGMMKTLLSAVREVVTFDKLLPKDAQGANTPKLMLIFGDSLSIAFDVLEYLQGYVKMFEKYPMIITLPGVSSSKYIDWGMPEETWLKTILTNNGVPEKKIQSLSSINDVKDFIRKHHYRHVSVFAARGYSVSTIVTLEQLIPEINFRYFEKEYVSKDWMAEEGVVSNCVFDTDKLSSVEMDLLLGQLVRLNLKREKLPEYLQEYLMPLEIVKKFTDKGYILGLNTEEEMNAVGISLEEFNEMLPKRLADFEWIPYAKNRVYEQIMSLKK